jgi:hypothetical protein
MVDMSIFRESFDMLYGLVDRIDDSLYLVSQGLIGQPVLYLSRAIRLLQALTGRAVKERCPSASSHELVSPLFERITCTTNRSWSRLAPRARRGGAVVLDAAHPMGHGARADPCGFKVVGGYRDRVESKVIMDGSH